LLKVVLNFALRQSNIHNHR